MTIDVMLTLVAIGYLVASRLRLGALERNAELLAGLAVAGSGVAIRVLGI